MTVIENLLGSNLWTFIGLTLILFGAIAVMTGRALAATWRPYWHALPYCLLLGLACRYLTFALFDGELLSLSGYLISSLCLLLYASLAYRVVLVRQMVRQYPWLCEAAGLFQWRAKGEP